MSNFEGHFEGAKTFLGFLNSGTLVFLCTRVMLCTVVVCCCLLLGFLVCCCVLLCVRGVGRSPCSYVV
jgi:hypothetical protein